MLSRVLTTALPAAGLKHETTVVSTDPLARLGFGQRLALAFAVVLALTAALGGAPVLNLSRVDPSSTGLFDKWLPSVGALAVARVAILEVWLGRWPLVI